MHAKNIGKYFKHCMQLPRKKNAIPPCKQFNGSKNAFLKGTKFTIFYQLKDARANN